MELNNNNNNSNNNVINNKNKNNHEEYQYLKLTEEIMKEGIPNNDRTGTGTKNIYGSPKMIYDCSNGVLPVFTTKYVWINGILKELLWFISGSTDSKVLKSQGVTIWDLNGSRENLDKLGFKERREGDLGPVYGFQWRHCGAEYVNCDTDYTGKGIDQLKDCINTIKNNPESRRIIVNTWNPVDIPKMVLPPCHMFFQFHCYEDKLSLELYQRSADMGLGVPFNVTSYCLLLHIISEITGRKPDKFIHDIGNAHVYNNHGALLDQIKRVPNDFPSISFKRKLTDIDDVKFEDFEIKNYKHQGKISLPMSL